MMKYCTGIFLTLLCLLVVLSGCTSQTAPPTPVTTAIVTTPAPQATQVSFETLPESLLTDSEREDIIYLQEAEKADHDLNLALFNQHQSVALFREIADKTEVAMTADNVILVRYDIPNPENQTAGQFTNKKLQRMYDTGVSSGSMSVTNALNSSAMYEDLHIADLLTAIGRTDNEDLKFIYNQELALSRNNLRQLSSTMTGYGSAYAPTYITPAYYQEIISSPEEPVLLK